MNQRSPLSFSKRPHLLRRLSALLERSDAILNTLLGVGLLALLLLLVACALAGNTASWSAVLAGAWAILRHGWVVFIFLFLALPLLRGEAQRHWHHFKKIRPWIVFQNMAVVVCVITTSILLNSTFPFLNSSWLHLLPGENNSTNLMVAPLSLRIVGPMFLVLLMLNVPSLAHAEEHLFRAGTRNWADGCKRSVLFGLCHCVMGVSLGTGLALSIPGLWFYLCYRRGGVQLSTLHHAVYNWIVFGIVGVLMFASTIK